jgi:hypothetical protein
MKTVVTTGTHTPRTHTPPFFAGIPIWVKHFLRCFLGIEPTTPSHPPPHPCRACCAATALWVVITSSALLCKPKPRSGRRNRSPIGQTFPDRHDEPEPNGKTGSKHPPGGGGAPCSSGCRKGRSKFPKCAGALRCSTRVLPYNAVRGRGSQEAHGNSNSNSPNSNTAFSQPRSPGTSRGSPTQARANYKKNRHLKKGKIVLLSKFC